MNYEPKFEKVPSKRNVCYLEEDIPEYVIILQSSHYHPNGEYIYYVIVEDPFELGEMKYMTLKEINKYFNININEKDFE